MITGRRVAYEDARKRLAACLTTAGVAHPDLAACDVLAVIYDAGWDLVAAEQEPVAQ